jgi:hypothetical protein
MVRTLFGCQLTLFLTFGLLAQVDNASLTGTVMDASNSAVQAAKVEAVSRGNSTRSANTRYDMLPAQCLIENAKDVS